MTKFVKLYESAIERFTRGGFLTGDLCKFIDGAFKDDFFGAQASNYVEKAKHFHGSGLNMRVSAVKAVRPNMHAGDVQNGADKFLIDVTLELAPGLYKDFLTIPAHLLQHIDTYPNLPPVPDSLKRANNVNIEPVVPELKDEDELMSSPHRQTGTSDVGDKKDSAGDRVLANTNTKIPSAPAIGDKDPAVSNGTARYLPKK